MKKIATLILALSVMTLISCGGSGSKGNSPSKVVKNYYEAIQAEKYDKAISYFEQAEEMQALVGKMEQTFREKEGVKTFQLGEEIISEDGNSATVEVITTHGDGEVEEMTFKLNKIDGEWKIDITQK
jgi:hypothetical protein